MNYTFKVISLAVLISLMGIFTIYSIAINQEEGNLKTVFMRQITWVALGVLVFFFVAAYEYRRLWDVTYVLYAIMLLLLILVLGLGHVRLGAQRWLKLFWLNFQPSEFAKLVTVIFLARYFSNKSVSDIRIPARSFGIFRGLVIPLVSVLIPMGLILEQPDLGTASMLFFVFIIMIYISDMRMSRIALLIFLVLLSLPVFWLFLRDYQRARLMVFMNPNVDPLGAGYTIIQSKIAIGSAGLVGKGWLFGTQSQLLFLPESHTDFIFAAFAEEWGLLGCLVLLVLYYILISYSFRIALRTSDFFGRLLAAGIGSMFAVQIVINIAMVMGLAPVVGLPLVLMSYGGSAVVVTFIALGILVNIDRRRAVF